MASLNITKPPTTKPTDPATTETNQTDPVTTNTPSAAKHVTFPDNSNLLTTNINPPSNTNTTVARAQQMGLITPPRTMCTGQQLGATITPTQEDNTPTSPTSCFPLFPVMDPSPRHVWN